MHALLLAAGLVIGAAPDGVNGVVVDKGGKPVPDAVVALVRQLNYQHLDKEATSKSDAAGRFAFLDWRDDGEQWFVVAYKPGLALGGMPVGGASGARAFLRSQQSSGDLKIRLAPPVKTRMRLIAPDGKPAPMNTTLAINRFAPTYEGNSEGQRLQLFSCPLPKALASSLDVRLGPDGAVSFDFLPDYCTYGLEIAAPGLGTQVASTYINPKLKDELTIQLQSVGSLTGQIVAADAKALRGLIVQVNSGTFVPKNQRKAPNVLDATGSAQVVTDDAGRFEVKAIAAGKAAIRVETRNELGWLPPAEITATVKDGETAEVKVDMARGVLLRGRVVGDEAREGIAGVVIIVGGQRVATDKNGDFYAYVRAGQVPVSISHIPLPWLAPLNMYRGEDVPAGAESHGLTSIKLKRGIPLEGIAVDEAGKVVAGAQVKALWRKTDGNMSTLGSDTAVADADGRFILQRVPGDAQLGLSAQTDERGTADLVIVPPGKRDALRITLQPDALVTFAGRVLDKAGKPIAGAKVQFQRAQRLPSGEVYGHLPVPLGDGPLMTDASGVFQTPLKLPRGEQYALTVEAPGMLKYESKSVIPPREGEPFRWPEVTLRQAASVSGRIVDLAGKPIEGASVESHGVQQTGRQGIRATAKTDSDGKFYLDKLHPDASLVFVEKDGYRPSGGLIPNSGELRVTLESRTAPPTARLKSSARPIAERRQLLTDLVMPILTRLGETDSDYFLEEALTRLAPLDKETTLKLIERIRGDGSRAHVLAALGLVDDALESAALVKDPYRRVISSFLRIADAADTKARKLQILGEALVHARTIEQPDQRVVVMCNIANRYAQQGDQAAARKILEECKPSAAQLAPTGWSGFARGHFAEALAPFDAAEAIKLATALKDGSDLTRHAGNIAHKLAAVHPAEAERALNLSKSDNYVTPYAVRVCYRMASVDLPRARRLADGLLTDRSGLGAYKKAHAYGVMALALAQKDPSTAKTLLNDAFDDLVSSVRRGSDRYSWPVAVTLLGYSETVDPGRTHEYFWRTIWMHPGPVADSWSPDERVERTHENNSQLALVLALYGQFPEFQAELMEPVFSHWSSYTNRGEFQFYRQNSVFTAMALVNPRRAIGWHTVFHPKVSKEDRRLIPQPWMTIADAFGHDGVELRSRIVEQVFHLWVIDKEDL